MAGYGFRLEAARPDERLKRRYSVKSEDVEMTPPFSTNLLPERLPAPCRIHLIKAEEPTEPLEEHMGLCPLCMAKSALMRKSEIWERWIWSQRDLRTLSPS